MVGDRRRNEVQTEKRSEKEGPKGNLSQEKNKESEPEPKDARTIKFACNLQQGRDSSPGGGGILNRGIVGGKKRVVIHQKSRNCPVRKVPKFQDRLKERAI